ncbi:hypothetical protein E3O06_17010 [Cryobacterium glaciale]|uniref:Tyr recombinase domain-containing protein n=1 Tax=Cryobacterium glaciale TaxID=1259145 RepID=A0A4V6QG64_9MICO|nr:tyrosine-type recombinase/integrase [Cryobacterium glaciale]TFB68195.1 hypothetical protein E3O06_17010 [Cryobacterium glaciale]
MAGRPRLPISTFGAIKTTEVGAGRFRSTTRFRDWDGQSRQVTATGSSRNAAETALKVELAARMRVGNVGDSVNAGSPFRLLAEAWLEDLMLDVDRANGTKKIVYEYELRGLVLPFFEHFTVREVSVGRIELFLKVQRAISYTRAKHSRTILSMVRTFREILRNAGLEGMGITPHAFRRTGTTLLANELGMQAAADVLGHTSTSTTKAHYAEPDRAVKSEPATVLQRLAPPS